MTAAAQPMASRHNRLPWAELLRRTFQVDVLTCSECGGRRQVIAYITEPPVVRAILNHLGLPSRALPLAPARDPLLGVNCFSRDDLSAKELLDQYVKTGFRKQLGIRRKLTGNFPKLADQVECFTCNTKIHGH